MIIVEIAGHLGADVETRVTPDGQKVSTLRMATNVRRGGRDETVWWRVTLWGDRWDKMLQYLTKGTGLIIIGEMQKPEIFQNRDGQSQISLDIRADIVKFSPFGRTDRAGGEGQQQQQGSRQQGSFGGAPQQQQQSNQQVNPYGRPPAETTAGMGSQSFGEVPDEDLPF
ncbi:MAG: single-stranded DNA-binding protein [Chlamydiales bacterium]|nr:single-stranded DNA-binding protein [Chlamydiales bacterium]